MPRSAESNCRSMQLQASVHAASKQPCAQHVNYSVSSIGSTPGTEIGESTFHSSDTTSATDWKLPAGTPLWQPCPLAMC